jgi:ribosomal protein S18 acetylase RimI-like enzyme
MPLASVTIRTELKPGDIGCVTYLHGKLYSKEYNYGIEFESYVAAGLHEFQKQYDPERSRVWVCEDSTSLNPGSHLDRNRIVGFLLLMDRGDAAQLRYFILLPEYRGTGLGNRLMTLYVEFLKQCGYKSSYLWTTDELPAAAHLYMKFGFKLVEEKPSTAFGKPLKEQRYDLIL